MTKTSSHYLKVLLELARQLDIDEDALLTEIGISRQQLERENFWIDNSCLTAVLKTLWLESQDESVGIDLMPIQMGTWALACDYMISAETLGDLYRRGQHIYSYLTATSMGVNFKEDEKEATVEVLGYLGDRDPLRFLMEFLNIVWHRFACWAIDEYIPLKQACFSYPAPDHECFYDELFHCPIVFDQAFCGFSFSKKYLSYPICRNRAELALWLRDSPADLLYMPGRDNSISHYIQKTLISGLRQYCRFPVFDDICESLHMSPQVVRRRLEEEGSSYQKLKDIVRSDLIKELLANPDLSIADITERSGFTEVASLNRAFKKWNGMTPVQYRDQKTSKLKH